MTGGPAQGTPAVVLATRPLGEADLLVVLMTPDRGKLRAAARNARRSRRRFAGGLPGGALGRASLVAPRTAGGLWRLDAFVSLRDLSGLGRDLARFAYVAYLCELTDALVHEPEPDPGLFAALSDAIERVLAGRPSPAVLRRYELRLLLGLGLLPSLRECCVCGTEVPVPAGGTVPFDVGRGGVLCLAHAQAAPGMPAGVVDLARALLEPGDAEADDAALAAAGVEARRAVRDLTLFAIRGQLRRPLRSQEFFAQLAIDPDDGPR